MRGELQADLLDRGSGKKGKSRHEESRPERNLRGLGIFLMPVHINNGQKACASQEETYAAEGKWTDRVHADDLRHKGRAPDQGRQYEQKTIFHTFSVEKKSRGRLWNLA